MAILEKNKIVGRHPARPAAGPDAPRREGLVLLGGDPQHRGDALRPLPRDRNESKSGLASPDFLHPDLIRFGKKSLNNLEMLTKFTDLRQFPGISRNAGKTL